MSTQMAIRARLFFLNSPFGHRQAAVLEVDVKQVDVPRQFDIVHDVGFDDLPCDGLRSVLRRVVNVAVAGIAEQASLERPLCGALSQVARAAGIRVKEIKGTRTVSNKRSASPFFRSAMLDSAVWTYNYS